nr:immunoglobulin heavy chain junction region [Macaca mulatta]MOV56839.1 immunoglobulin heavy chain junction region [Macaca mulatta]MOV58803.1 immunoglobulin heavy chain junction region [Macaca mulatta]
CARHPWEVSFYYSGNYLPYGLHSW